MCRTCGCAGASDAPPQGAGHAEHHHHDHDHEPDPPHAQDPARARIRLERAVLEKNDRLAEDNRRWLRARRITALNLLSAPGSGKTTLLERTIHDIGAELGIGVIEGDQATANDAERIRAAGGRAVQINTGAGCHLDAGMVAAALPRLDPPIESLVMIENVGNLVCPALFELGEHAKVVIVAVTEGDDKPSKYPHVFRASELMILNKIDLLSHVRFDVDRCVAHAHTVNPRLRTLQVSATRGDGLESWYGWLRERMMGRRPATG